MPSESPPQIDAAIGQLRQALAAVEKREIDPLTAPWAEVETGVIKLLGGAFSPRSEAHHNLAFMVGAALAERLRRDLGAFWFPHRGTPVGAALGFPVGIIVFSPFPAALQALSRGRLTMLDDVAAELGRVTGQARMAQPAGERSLGPEDYRRLFDPGFVQFVCLETAAARACWERRTDAEIAELEDAFKRLPARIPVEARQSLRAQVIDALRQLDATQSLGAHAAAAPQLVELLTLVHAAVASTGFAPLELWEGVLLPLVHIGAPATFPPVDDEVREGFKHGAPPLVLYVESLPFQTPAADEDGLLGVFPVDEIQLVDASFANAESMRLARVDPRFLREPLSRFEPAAVRANVERFRAALAGPEAPPPAEERPSLLDVSLTLVEDLGRVVKSADEAQGILCVRHATEAEAASEPLLVELHKVLTGPRIILP